MAAASLLPFLYQTRTLQRLPRIALLNGSQLYRGTRSTRPFATREGRSPIPFDLPPDLHDLQPEDAVAEAGDPTEAEPGRQSTITPTERHAFDFIFNEIATRYGAAGSSTEPATKEGAATEESHRVPGTVSSLVREGRRDMQKQARRTPPGLIVEPEQRERAIRTFPTSLQRSLRRSLDPNDVRNVQKLFLESLTEESLGTTMQLELVRNEERARMEALMRDAPTDVALWEILEKEVFTMVERLGISETTSQQAETGAVRGPKRRGRKKASTTGPASSLTAAPVVSPQKMSVHGPLYPSYLLLALRLFDSAFASPSPLGMALLPRIKQLGLASYVLGATTPLYNELAGMMWRRSADPGAVLDLLEEMRHAGLLFDEGSLRVIDSIREQLRRATERGGFAAGAVLVTQLGHDTGERLVRWSNRLREWLGKELAEA